MVTPAVAEATGSNLYDLDDVHGNFVSWFTWGFLNYLLLCVFSCMSGLLGKCNQMIGMICFYMVGCV